MKSFKKFLVSQFGVPEKPIALPFETWRIWYAKAKKEYPFRYFMSETLPDFASVINKHTFGRFNDARYALYNRFIYKKYALTSNLPRGEWYDFDTRLLNGVMDEVVNFVEVESAIHHCCMDRDEAKKFGYNKLVNRWLFSKFRSAEAGLAHVNWAAGLRSSEIEGDWVVESGVEESFGPLTHQAETARELLAIYNWWKIDRPARPEPYAASGWSAYCERTPMFSERVGDSGKKELELLRIMEVQQEEEDTEFLIRAVKVRRGLWT